MHAPPVVFEEDLFFDKSSPAPLIDTISGAGLQDRKWISCGPFLAEAVEEVVVDTVDRLSQADRLPQAGMLGMQEQEPVGPPELEQEEGSHPSLPPGNTRNHPKL